MSKHLPNDGLGHEEKAARVDCKDPVELLPRDVGEGLHPEDACTVDERIDAARPRNDVGDEGIDRVTVTHVERVAEASSANLGCHRLTTRPVDIGDADPGALLRETPGDGETDPARATRHDRRLVLQSRGHPQPPACDSSQVCGAKAAIAGSGLKYSRYSAQLPRREIAS